MFFSCFFDSFLGEQGAFLGDFVVFLSVLLGFSWGKGFSLCFRFFLMIQLHRFFLTDLTAQVVLCLRSLRFQVAIKNFRRIKFHAVLQLHNLHEHT